MALITDYFGISDPVPFVDVEVSTDNLMFVDPCAIRLGTGPGRFRDYACYCLDTFFKEVSGCVMSASSADHRRGLDLVQHFGEPRETRLGMAAAGIDGHGGAKVVGATIWDALSGSNVEALIRIGLLREVEALPLFVSGIDRDITSDLTTRIVYQALADFTEATVNEFPAFRSRPYAVTTVIRQVWDPDQRRWDEKPVRLPVAADKPLLLVPRGWVRPALLMSSRRYYETAVLSWAQLEQAVERDGRLLKTPKHELRRQAVLARGRRTNLEVTLRAFEREEEDLIGRFQTWVAHRWASSGGAGAA